MNRENPIREAYVNPEGWTQFRDGNRVFYISANPATDDGDIATHLGFQEAHLVMQRLGLRCPTDREYNTAVHQNPRFGNDMDNNCVWTGFLKDVRKIGHGFTALYVPTPIVTVKGDGFEIAGDERSVKLPENGWFRISELLQSETGLPERTVDHVTAYDGRGDCHPEDTYGYFCEPDDQQEAAFILRGMFSKSSAPRFHFELTCGDATCVYAASSDLPKISLDRQRAANALGRLEHMQRLNVEAENEIKDLGESMRRINR